MPGEEQRHHLVADLLARERVAVLVARLDEQREQVLAEPVAGAAAVDLGEEQRVEPPARPQHPRVRRARPRATWPATLRAWKERAASNSWAATTPRAGQVGDADLSLRGVGVQPEQRPHRDPQRQVARPA